MWNLVINWLTDWLNDWLWIVMLFLFYFCVRILYVSCIIYDFNGMKQRFTSSKQKYKFYEQNIMKIIIRTSKIPLTYDPSHKFALATQRKKIKKTEREQEREREMNKICAIVVLLKRKSFAIIQHSTTSNYCQCKLNYTTLVFFFFGRQTWRALERKKKMK